MTINWSVIILLVLISAPGVFIAMTRLAYFLLPNNTEELKKRISRLLILQAFVMVLAMSFTGSILSKRTGLEDPILNSIMQGRDVFNTFLASLLPVVSYALLCFIAFAVLYYVIVRSILDKQSLERINKLRAALKVDGCVLFGIVEEVIARWGLMNLVTFFVKLFIKQVNDTVIWTSIVISGLMFALGQIPLYIAAGCRSDRRVMYSIVLLSLCQSLFFGYLFWQYGLIAAMIAHSLFHIFWFAYDKA